MRDGETVSTANQGTSDADPTTRHAALRYTVLRLGVFAGCFAVLWALAWFRVLPVGGSLGVVLLLALAAVVSAPVSYVLLSRQRDAMSQQIAVKVAQTRQRLAASKAQEDAAEDATAEAVAPVRRASED